MTSRSLGTNWNHYNQVNMRKYVSTPYFLFPSFNAVIRPSGEQESEWEREWGKKTCFPKRKTSESLGSPNDPRRWLDWWRRVRMPFGMVGVFRTIFLVPSYLFPLKGLSLQSNFANWFYSLSLSSIFRDFLLVGSVVNFDWFSWLLV